MAVRWFTACVYYGKIMNPLQPSGHYMYRQFNIQQFYILPTQCVCVSCGSENKQRLFHCTALTGWFLYLRRSVFTARYVHNSTFCPHSVFMCFVRIWEQTAIISLYSIDWLVFVTETECVYCAVRSQFYVLPTQCVYAFVWIWEKTAIISQDTDDNMTHAHCLPDT